jgi:hypothetical protein
MKTMQTAADKAQEPKRESSQPKDTYRAPRLMPLGTTIDLVRGFTGGQISDGMRGWAYR